MSGTEVYGVGGGVWIRFGVVRCGKQERAGEGREGRGEGYEAERRVEKSTGEV